MKKPPFIIIFLLLILSISNAFSQNKSTYKQNGTEYIYGDYYSTTGKPMVERSQAAKKEFLKTKGLKKIPSGYQIDHINPLSEGGSDTPSNMQLISVDRHKLKTAGERSRTASNSTYKPSGYKSSSTYNSPSSKSASTYKLSESYSSPSYSNSSGKIIYTGSKGGKYYYNSSGRKTYVKRR